MMLAVKSEPPALTPRLWNVEALAPMLGVSGVFMLWRAGLASPFTAGPKKQAPEFHPFKINNCVPGLSNLQHPLSIAYLENQN